MRAGFWLTAALLAPATVAGNGAAAAADALAQAYAASEADTFREPDPQEVRRAEKLFRRLFSAGQDAQVRTQRHDVAVASAAKAAEETAPEWLALGFELLRIEALSGPPHLVWIVREQAARREGRGLFVVVPGTALHLLQVPHRRDDFHTGELGLKLLGTGRFAGAAWNTARRRDLDLAHRDSSFFTAFTSAWASVHARGLALQLHGFEAANYPQLKAEAVLSAGTSKPTPAARAYAGCLMTQRIADVALYGRDTREPLGGTRNALGRLLRARGHRGFLHLEMNRELRQRLLDDDATLRRLADCLP